MPRTCETARCWANGLGNCAGRLSGEHVVSQSVFLNGTLNVQGTRWAEQALAIPRTGITARILCARHNGALSALDSEAGRLSAAIREFMRVRCDSTITVDGWTYERWCLKTLINLGASGWLHERGEPPLPLVEWIFGRRRPLDKRGLFVVSPSSFVDTGVDYVAWNTVSDAAARSRICGALLNLRGVVSMITTASGDPEPLARTWNTIGGVDFGVARLHHRPSGVELCGSYPAASLRVSFRW